MNRITFKFKSQVWVKTSPVEFGTDKNGRMYRKKPKQVFVNKMYILAERASTILNPDFEIEVEFYRDLDDEDLKKINKYIHGYKEIDARRYLSYTVEMDYFQATMKKIITYLDSKNYLA